MHIYRYISIHTYIHTYSYKHIHTNLHKYICIYRSFRAIFDKYLNAESDRLYKRIERHIIEVEIDALINASMEIIMNELLKKQQVYIYM
jgi:hypothetical protein